jgi:hypothetical protein
VRDFKLVEWPVPAAALLARPPREPVGIVPHQKTGFFSASGVPMPSLAEKRPTGQFPVNAGTTCPFVAPVVENFGSVKVWSVSMEGVCLVLTRPVEPGVVLAISLANPGKGFTKTAFARVVRVAAGPEGCLVHGTFVDPLTYQELTALVL